MDYFCYMKDYINVGCNARTMVFQSSFSVSSELQSVYRVFEYMCANAMCLMHHSLGNEMMFDSLS